MIYVRYYNLITKLQKKERRKEYKRLEDIKYDPNKLDGFHLWCYNEKITEIPKNIFEFKNLEYLIISNTKINEIPKEIKYLTNLISLELDNTNISKLPKLDNLINLKILCIDNSKISVIPKEIFKLKNLIKLHLSHNQISIIPIELFNLINLECLYLDSNNIEIIPKEIGLLTNLKSFSFNHNYKIYEIPIEILNCKKIEYIGTNDNIFDRTYDYGKQYKDTPLNPLIHNLLIEVSYKHNVEKMNLIKRDLNLL
jgi:Leucine-rich repeat (LRR) protein